MCIEKGTFELHMALAISCSAFVALPPVSGTSAQQAYW